MARVYLILGVWQWALTPALDNESIQVPQDEQKRGTPAVLFYYSLGGRSSYAAHFIVATVSGYFHSIACVALAKGVDDSLQDEFKSIEKFKIYNTNNLLVNLNAIKRLMQGDGLKMDIIPNPKVTGSCFV